MITDEFMQEMLGRSRTYTLVLLKATERRGGEENDAIVWEHGRRNFELRERGLMSIVGPVLDDTWLSGVAIFSAEPGEVARLMDEDPAVKAGLFVYELHPLRSFPGDALGA